MQSRKLSKIKALSLPTERTIPGKSETDESRLTTQPNKLLNFNKSFIETQRGKNKIKIKPINL